MLYMVLYSKTRCLCWSRSWCLIVMHSLLFCQMNNTNYFSDCHLKRKYMNTGCHESATSSVAALQPPNPDSVRSVWSFMSSPNVCVGFCPPPKTSRTGYFELPLVWPCTCMVYFCLVSRRGVKLRFSHNTIPFWFLSYPMTIQWPLLILANCSTIAVGEKGIVPVLMIEYSTTYMFSEADILVGMAERRKVEFVTWQ